MPGNTSEWFEDFDRHFRLRPDDTGSEEAAFIARALKLRRGDAVLDIPCGAGRVAVQLARMGCRVTGVDLTAGYLRRARKRFADERLRGSFRQSDMRDIDFVETFDGIFNWQGSFGFFSDSENRDLLKRLAQALRPDGRLLVDQPNRQWILRHFRAVTTRGTVTSRTAWNPTTQRAETRYRDTASGERWRMSIRLYTPAQFRALFHAAGLELLAIYGGTNGAACLPGSRRTIVVGRKPRPQPTATPTGPLP